MLTLRHEARACINVAMEFGAVPLPISTSGSSLLRTNGSSFAPSDAWRSTSVLFCAPSTHSVTV